MPTLSKKTVPLQRLLSAQEIEELTEPLLEIFDCDHISLTNLKVNYNAVIPKLYQTGRPLLLGINGYRLLLCDPNRYIELERRRQWILGGCKTLEELIQVGKVDCPDESVQKLAALKSQIAETKREIKALQWDQAEAATKLASMQTEADSLRKALRKKRQEASANV